MSDPSYILIVEDDPVLKNLLGHTLGNSYQTLYASTGKDGIEAFETHHPKLVLLDLMLSGEIDGFGVLAHIRSKSDSYQQTPVIIISNLGQQSDKDKAMQMGANEYLVKAEVSVEEIVDTIKRVLGA